MYVNPQLTEVLRQWEHMSKHLNALTQPQPSKRIAGFVDSGGVLLYLSPLDAFRAHPALPMG